MQNGRDDCLVVSSTGHGISLGPVLPGTVDAPPGHGTPAIATRGAGQCVEASGVERVWTLRRNCSMSPRDLGALFVCLGLTTFGVATVCALSGAWFVLIFAAIEVGALAVTFIVYARHAGDCERLTLTARTLRVESDIGGRLTVSDLPRAWVRVNLQSARNSRACERDRLVELGASGRKVTVGRFLTPRDRRGLADELNRVLRLT